MDVIVGFAIGFIVGIIIDKFISRRLDPGPAGILYLADSDGETSLFVLLNEPIDDLRGRTAVRLMVSARN